jgi:hypothetical protein
MKADDFLNSFLDPGLDYIRLILGEKPPINDEVRVELLAIAGQESNWQNIRQGDGGPARGPWQFEPEACQEILANPASASMAAKIILAVGVAPARVYANLISMPKLSVAFSRFNLWCDREPLPKIGDEEAALACYVRVWRPGAITGGGQRAIATRARWTANYQAAVETVTASTK